MRPVRAFVDRELAARARPEHAAAAAAYMKSEIPCLGVPSADMREVARLAARRFPVAGRAAYEADVLAVWSLPHRDGRHVAVALAREHSALVTPSSIGLYERLIREGAWWDFVDEVAPHLVGLALSREPDGLWPVMDRWIEDDDMWVRRAALLCQLAFKARTDERRLFAYCLARAGEREFFVRKAIGWALRQYARTAPDAVRRFLAEHAGELSALSVREASKHL